MGSEASKLPDQTITQISSETGFTKPQVEVLWKRFQVLDTDQKGYLTRQNLLDLPELRMNPVSLSTILLNLI